jgi:hypothetical protein
MAAFTMIVRRKAIERSKRMALFIFFVVNVIGLLLQMLNGQLHTELFVQALALTGIMLTIENEDERMDLTTKVYNRGALLPDLNTYLRLRNPFSVICIRITNSDMLQRLLGVIDSDRLLQKVAEYLKTVENVVSYFKVSDLLYACSGVEDVTTYTLNGDNVSVELDDTDYPVVGEVQIVT